MEFRLDSRKGPPGRRPPRTDRVDKTRGLHTTNFDLEARSVRNLSTVFAYGKHPALMLFDKARQDVLHAWFDICKTNFTDDDLKDMVSETENAMRLILSVMGPKA